MPRVSLGRVELAEGTMRGFPRGRRPGILLARRGGRYFALDDWCNHAGALLSEGRLEGGAVVCPLHRMAFDLRDGRLLTVPRLCGDQRAYPVELVDGEILVELPSPLVHRLLPPRQPTPRPPLLLLLHGRGLDETDLLPAAAQLDPRLLVASARAPRPAGTDGFGWYDVDVRRDPPRKDPAQVLVSRDLVIALLE
jgi:3-phenylpropionate/trans-cinnamate dioxygenase ferredoxin subunit